jgi:histidyl-tRNA synthetase|tara:strand:- start:3593 stop:4930 length:1338 start_codon:yes stop_codon:yes gene_type:complete
METMKIKPALPKGMRDFLPADVRKRQYIIQTIKESFELFGFQAIETPVMENLNTLVGKYGDEGDKLLFKVLNSGDYLKKVAITELGDADSRKLTPKIADKGLRYDLTVPLARYVVQHQNEISFPFKRYHIAPVWRADRPQKGRYREFFQCDADIIGSKSLYNEVELIQIYSSVFEKLNLAVTIKYNNRKILIGLMQALGLSGREQDGIVLLDKLDKIGLDRVLEEFKTLGLSQDQLTLFKTVVSENDIHSLPHSELIQQGIEELEFVKKFNIPSSAFDITLARGLDYYTGCIFEVVSNEYEIGSVGGGGRYDNLTEMFGKSDLTGVGISFGLDRIYDVLEGLGRFPETLNASASLMFAHYDDANQSYAFEALGKLRAAGISAELYPDKAKFQKQIKYANDKGISFVAIVGDNEMKNETLMLKNMETGEQEEMSIKALINYLNSIK